MNPGTGRFTLETELCEHSLSSIPGAPGGGLDFEEPQLGSPLNRPVLKLQTSFRNKASRIVLTSQSSVDNDIVLVPTYWGIRKAGGAWVNWLIVPLSVVTIVYMVIAKIVWLRWAFEQSEADGFGTEHSKDAARLGMVQGACLALAGVFITGGSCRDLSLAAHPDGALHMLGLGTEKVSLRAKKLVDCANMFFMICWSGMSIVAVVQINAILVDPERVGMAKDSIDPNLKWDAMSFCDWTGSGLFNLVSAFVGPFWALSLAVAATLAYDAIAEVVNAIAQADPTNEEEWHVKVQRPTLRLAEVTMHHLSSVFATGLVGCFAGGFTGAIGSISGYFGAVAAHTEDGATSPNLYLLYATFYFAIPFCITAPLAATSTKCDELLEMLNLKRVRGIEARAWDADTESRLHSLERALRKMNKGRGLGFTVTGTVIDKKLLHQTFGLVFSVLATVIPSVLLLQPAPESSLRCALTDAQQNSIKAIVSTWDSGCSYNFSYP